MSSDRETLVWESKIAEQAEKYQSMLEAVKKLYELVGNLNYEERNLFAVACKGALGPLRSSWRVLAAIESQTKKGGNEARIKIAKEYVVREEVEITKFCRSFIDFITQAKTTVSDDTVKIFTMKTVGDHYRYIAEVTSNPEEKKEVTDHALQFYEKATALAGQSLSETDPLRLGLALNFAVFQYEVLNQTQKAIDTAKTAFDHALAKLDHVSEEDSKEILPIMQLLKDNSSHWSDDLNEE